MTFGQRIEEIIDELERNDLAVQTRRLYLEAVQGYKDTRFPIAMNRTLTFVAADFTGAYAELPVDFSSEQQVVVEFGNVREVLKPISHERMQTIANEVVPQGGIPDYYTIRGNEITIWPMITTQTIRVYCLSNLTPPDDDDDTSFWTDEGGLLIKYKTKALVLANVIMDPQSAMLQLQLAEGSPDRVGGELLRLMAVVERRALRGTVDPYLGGTDFGPWM